MNDKAMRGLMTTTEVATFFRTSPETVRYWRHVGYGPVGRKVGRRVLYERADVEVFWEALRGRPGR